MLGDKGANSSNVYYETPKTGNFGKSQMSLASLKKEFSLTLDPCAPMEAYEHPERSCCKKFYTEKDDGLSQPWPENCFVNPIYTPKSKDPVNNIDAWLRKGVIESQKFGTTNVFLIPAYTGSAWWHTYVIPYGTIRYIEGRVRCWIKGKVHPSTPNIDFVIVIFSHPNPKSYPWSES